MRPYLIFLLTIPCRDVKIEAKGAIKTEAQLIEKISAVSDEERRILAGSTIDKELYGAERDFVVSSDKLTGCVRDITVRTHTRYTDFPLHKHNYLEMMIVLGGSITHIIGDEEITLGRGDILVMNKHVSHSIKKAETPDIGVNVILSDAFVESLASEIYGTVFSELAEENAKSEGAGIYLSFSTDGKKQIANIVENLLFELTEYHSTDSRILRYTTTLLFDYLSKKSDKLLRKASRLPDREAERKSAILSYVRDSYKDASLSVLASKMFLSVPYLSKLITQYFGKSFKALLLEERLHRAEQLLLNTDMPIGDVIAAVGYENKSYFCREFKERFGCAPFALRTNSKAISKKKDRKEEYQGEQG